MSVKGDFSTLNRLKKNLRTMPVSLAHDVAKRTAPAVTNMTQASFNSGRTVYDDPRPRGTDGRPLTLRRTGKAEKVLSFAVSGRIIRSLQAPPEVKKYLRYLIGKYGVLPMGRIPARWQSRIAELVASAKVKL